MNSLRIYIPKDEQEILLNGLPKLIELNSYLGQIKRMQCMVPGCCNWQVDKHHIYKSKTQAMRINYIMPNSKKVDDFYQIPLCRMHHNGSNVSAEGSKYEIFIKEVLGMSELDALIKIYQKIIPGVDDLLIKCSSLKHYAEAA